MGQDVFAIGNRNGTRSMTVKQTVKLGTGQAVERGGLARRYSVHACVRAVMPAGLLAAELGPAPITAHRDHQVT